MKRFLRSLPPLFIYFLALPWAALRLDRWFHLIWRLPFWIEPLATVMVLGGIALAALRRSRNPLMLGGWLYGAGLACLLRSPCLLGLVGIVAVAGTLHLCRIEEPRIASRFGAAWTRYMAHTPRWIVLALVAAATLAGLPALTMDRAQPPAATDPAVLVQIRCKPGTAALWRADFDQHVKPAIDEVIARGDMFTAFQIMEPALPWQGFDFLLLYTGKTFAGLDQPRPFPHYVALFQREGSLRALAALKEMSTYEDQVTVTLVHLNRAR